MTLPVQTFDQIVNAQATAMQANSTQILDFNTGSVLRALIEANAANSLWLQALATTLLSVTRLSTSSGLDVDTFIQDFGFVRPGGTAAFGNVTFSRFTVTVAGSVPVGTIISESSTNLTFIVTLDASNPRYDSVTNSYIVPINTSSMSVPCVCSVSGVVGNVIAGAINTINNPVLTPGIDSVTNPAAFTNGTDPASDTQTKQDFLLYIQSLSRATLQAIQYAVATVNIGTEKVVRYNVVENVNEAGAPQLGYFYVVVDNGTGTPCSDALITAVANNVELYRGLTIQYNIDKAQFTALTIVVSVRLVSAPTETNTVIQNKIISALQTYTSTIGFGEPFLYSKISEIVYDCDSNVASIPSSAAPTLNGGNSDIAALDNLHIFGVPAVTVNIL